MHRDRPLIRFAVAITLVSANILAAAEPVPKIKTLILDGQNNHNWRATTPVIRAVLQDSGRFSVHVATMPPAGTNASGREKFAPAFGEYSLVVSNFTDIGGPPAPREFLDRLTKWVASGGAFVAVHAATAGMDSHAEYLRMVGLGWGAPNRGDRLVVETSGRILRTLKDQGDATGHGPHVPIDVTIWAAKHPIVKGLPRNWQTGRDELWFSARGPAQDLTILATGYSPHTKQNEPVLWTVHYGKGRVFVTLLGHDENCMKDAGFQTTLTRGCEWAARGEVSVPIPSFPAVPK